MNFIDSVDSMNNKHLEELITKYYELIKLEQLYKNNGLSRLVIYEQILKLLPELASELDLFKGEIDEKQAAWRYHAIGNKSHIELPSKDLFLKVLLLLLNKTSQEYDILKLKVIELFPDEEDSRSFLAKFRNASILASKNVLKKFKDSTIYHADLINRLNELTLEGHSFVFDSDLIKEYPGEYIQEKISVSEGHDLIISTPEDDELNIALNKIITYISKYGSDFSNIDQNTLVTLISTEKAKIRKLSKNRYIDYTKE